jgi:cell division septation protein DedD
VSRGRPFLCGALVAAISAGLLTLDQLRPDARAESRDGVVITSPGAIPLIKAETGPIKVKPQNPGGLEVPHKDKAIYERFETHRKVVPAGDPKKPQQTASSTKPGQKNLAQAIGPYRAQLGSFASTESAQRRWQELRSRHSDLIGGLQMVLERVEVRAKGTMVRLQAGPLKTADEVQKLCAALAKRKVGCFLVKS